MAAFADTKPHYDLLDGLRGVAAITVVWFHIFEAFATSHLDQRINHGYLAVDFFFILSGFVIGYAYDDRWGKMKTKDFIKRRVIRLHPMVVMGAIIGAVMFYWQSTAASPTACPWYSARWSSPLPASTSSRTPWITSLKRTLSCPFRAVTTPVSLF